MSPVHRPFCIFDLTACSSDYTTQQASLASNLTYANANTFIMRVDHTTTLNSSSTVGRQSVRIKSNAQYGTHMAVFDIRHMPQGCGTWPAIWEADDSVGIVNGELDILEGVNSLSPSYTTLHTPGSCTLSATRSQTGYVNCPFFFIFVSDLSVQDGRL